MKEAEKLLHRYRHGIATDEERAKVESWYLSYRSSGADEGLSPDDLEAEHYLGRRQLEQAIRIRRLNWLPRVAAAAAILLLLGLSLHRWYLSGENQPQSVATRMENIVPGKNRATLHLADGREIELDEDQSGIVLSETQVHYADGSALAETRSDAQYIMLATPRSGTYQVTLPDGSKVWLNAASSIKYAPDFLGGERLVELSGEAYFEVEPAYHTTTGAGQGTPLPFKVMSAGQTVEVLGTKFNVAAYDGEALTATTLVEGQVRVTQAGDHDPASATHLHPGQQSVLSGNSLTVQAVDVDRHIAWKSGRFSFDDKPFDRIMDEVSRWYDIDVVYEDGVPSEKFFGDAFRTDNLSVILKLLDNSQIGYRLTDDHKLIITNRTK